MRPPATPSLVALCLIGSTVLGCGSAGRRDAPEAAAPAARPPGLTILAVNDLYRIEGVDGGVEGGPGRVRALRAELEEAGEQVLLLHGGDVLFPSLMSREYGGAQMIDVLNLLDGDPEAFDRRMFATFGNHEFDEAKLEEAGQLAARLRESQFGWLGTNVVFGDDDAGLPLVDSPTLSDSALLEIGGVRVGLFSVTTDEKRPAYVDCIRSPLGTARRATAALRERGAELVIALTHQFAAQDLEILETLGADGPDLVIGGHDHEAMAERRGGRWLFKADVDARSASIVRVRPGGAGGWIVDRELRRLRGAAPAPDPQVEERVAAWKQRYDSEICVGRLGLERGCLDDVIGRTRTRLRGEELEIRRFETSLGNWVADRMLEAFAARGAQVAFINSGSLRLNQDLPAGAEIRRRHIEELFAYPAPLRLIAIDGATLQRVVSHAVEDWIGSGWWLQIAGFAFRHDPDAGTASDLTLLAPEGPRPIAPGETLLAVTNEFLVEPSGGQDGFTMLGPDQVRDGAGDLKQRVVEALAAAGEEGIAPAVEGRICNPRRAGACLAVRP